MIPMRNMMALVILLQLTLSGCASQNMRSQALDPGAENIDNISESLVFMPVHIKPTQANMKLNGIILINTETEEWNIISFFNNIFLGSDTVPHSVEDGEVVQYLLLDLPAGEYRLSKMDFSFLWETRSGGFMDTELTEEIILRVPEQNQVYAGRLSIDIQSITVSGLSGTKTYSFPLPQSVEISKLFDGLQGDLHFDVDDRLSEDLERAIERYPGLGTVDFTPALLQQSSP